MSDSDDGAAASGLTASDPAWPYNAKLINRRDVHDALAIFTVALDSGPVAPFQPGQYTTLGLMERDEQGAPVMGRRGPKLMRRAFRAPI